MSERAETLLQQVLALPEADRTAVRRALNARRRAEAADADHAEIMRRSDSVMDGSAVLVDAEESIRRMRAQLAANRVSR